MFFSPLRKKLLHRADISLPRVEAAYQFAQKAHTGQKRKNGDEYITHPVAVAILISDMGGDEESILAALLHDTVEDTMATKTDIEILFGKNVANLVDGLTKLKKESYTSLNQDAKIETIRKWLLAVKDDLRIAVIKLCDRLHNMESVNILPSEKRLRIAQQTLDVYSKIAKWLSLQDIRRKLEETSLQVLVNPQIFEDIQKEIEKGEQKIHSALEEIQKKQEEEQMPFPISFEPALFSPQYAFFCLQEHKNFQKAFPLKIRCIVPHESDCYTMLAFFHGHWEQKKKTFEDFIGAPKPNGYKGLRTSIFLKKGFEVRVEIMTEAMSTYAHRGVSLFCFTPQSNTPEPLPWITKMDQLLEVNVEKSIDFWNGIQNDLLDDFIVVYGQTGEAISLPRNSTHLDAASALLGEKFFFLKSVRDQKSVRAFGDRVFDGDQVFYELALVPHGQ